MKIKIKPVNQQEKEQCEGCMLWEVRESRAVWGGRGSEAVRKGFLEELPMTG